MADVSTVQVWEAFDEPCSVEEDITDSRFRIKAEPNPSQLPESIAGEVGTVWKDAKESKGLYDGQILYLVETDDAEEPPYEIDTDVRGFRHTYVFNRDPAFYSRWEDVATHDLLSLSTHCHLRTADNQLLFGRKTNQDDQVTGFSGFPDMSTETATVDDEIYLDTVSTIENRLEPETGELADTITDISAVGVTYVDTPGLRGTDSDYLVTLDVDADTAEDLFTPKEQFHDDLYTVDFSPDAITTFIEETGRGEHSLSDYAKGCLYAEVNAFYDEAAATDVAETIQDTGTSCSTTDERGYLD